MQSGNNNPSIDPANNGSLAGTLRFTYGKLLQQTDGMLPAQVIQYDRAANRVQVQILISLLTTDGSIVPRSQIASLPVLLLGGGGFALSFPLKPGDLGWISANDRDISLFLQTFSQQPPNTSRIKSFSDALFIPDVMHGMTITDANSVVLQSLDGTVAISLDTGIVTITAPVIMLDGDVTVTGALAAEGGMSMTGGAGPNPCEITGNVLVTGNIGATGTITPGV